MEVRDFQEIVWQKGRELFRPMPWREDTQPYFVMVSEIMLQQTQVDRVISKFLEFTQAFPTVESLAEAPLDAVLRLWSGLGYNRRAKFLHSAAKMIMTDFKGVFPSTHQDLIRLPGVGVNTAGAILAYSFNCPSVFIETNVRSVYFYHFFPNSDEVHDKELQALVETTLDQEHPREWYWALMDYGTYLKRNGAGQNSKSRHYKKQSPLKGSIREVRGQIVKQLALAEMTRIGLEEVLHADERFEKALLGLQKDGLIEEVSGIFHLTK
jgi:A/G-specific adenine glycosylase